MDAILSKPDPPDAVAVWALPPRQGARLSSHHVVLIVLLLVPMTLTATLGSISFSSPDGTAIVSFWPAAAFQIVFSIWFGVYGALAGIIGPMLGNALVGGSPFMFIPANAVQCCLAGLWFRYRRLDPRLRNREDWFGLIVVGCLAANALGAAFGVTEGYLRALGSGGATAQAGFWTRKLVTWFLGNGIPSLFLAPALLRCASPLIVRDPIFCQSFWGSGAVPLRHRRWSSFSDLPMGAKLTVLALVTGIVPLVLVATWSVWSTVKAADRLASAVNQRAAQQARNEAERHELLLELWGARLDRPGLSEDDRQRLLREWRAVPDGFRELEIAPRAPVEAAMPPEMRNAFRDHAVAFYEVPLAEAGSGSELRGAVRLSSAPDRVLTGLVFWREEAVLAEEWSSIEAVLVLDTRGNELFRTAPPELDGWHPQTPRPDSESYTVRHEGRTWHVAEALLTSPGRRFVTLISARTGMAFSLARIPNPVAVLVNLAIFGSIIAGSAVAGRISGRVLSIAEEVRKTGGKPGKLQLPVRGQDELGFLAQTLNRTSADLAVSVRQLQETTAEKERLETEIRVAAQVQAWMLPRKLPELQGADVFALTQPAREIGGDFYDFLQLGEGRLGLVIGDSSGKGLPAALHAAQSLSVIRGLARRNSDIREVLATVNEVLLGSGEGAGMFCTVFYGVFEPASRRLTFANAGHCRPILLSAGRPPVPLDHETSLPVGMAAQFEAVEQDARLQPGDLLVFYSDGVTEARNPNEELFGLQRLIECLANGQPREPRRIAECVSRAVSAFTATGEQADDITIVVLEATA